MTPTTDFWLCLAVVLAAIFVGVVVALIRADRVGKNFVLVVTVVCGAGLLAMILTDWPLGVASEFWADHSVLSSTLSSLLLVFLVFLIYERGAVKRQGELARNLSGAGLGGIVDHIVDIEVALALLSASGPPDEWRPQRRTGPPNQQHQLWSDWADTGKPLRWLRDDREVILANEDDDPRRKLSIRNGVTWWGRELIDLSTRRLLSAMRDWTPLIGASEDGTAVLLMLSTVRTDLMALRDLYPMDKTGDDPTVEVEPKLVSLRLRLRVLAACFEDWSGAMKGRPEILQTRMPLPAGELSFGDVGRSLRRRLAKAATDLGLVIS